MTADTDAALEAINKTPLHRLPILLLRIAERGLFEGLWDSTDDMAKSARRLLDHKQDIEHCDNADDPIEGLNEQ